MNQPRPPLPLKLLIPLIGYLVPLHLLKFTGGLTLKVRIEAIYRFLDFFGRIAL